MAELTAEAHYTRRRDAARAEVEALGSRAAMLSFARVLTIVAAIGLALAGYFAHWAMRGYAAGSLAFAVFVVLVLVHDSVFKKKARAERQLAWAEEGLARISHRWMRAVREGDPKSDDEHPYVGDLDVFGRGSLMQSLDTTRTPEGRALLAEWLSRAANADEIRTRQACARELATRTELREELAVEGALVGEEPPQIEPLLRWGEKTPSWSPAPVLRIAMIVLPTITLGILVFGAILPVPRWAWAVTLGIQLALAGIFRVPVREAIAAAQAHNEALARYQRMFGLIEAARFEGAPLDAMRRALDGASAESRALSRIVGFLDARRNEVWRLFIGPLLSWDLNCALSLEGWRRRAGTKLRGHLQTLSRFEAMCALATRAFERPDDAWPIVDDAVDDASIHFRAENLGHPLIDVKKAVRNDVVLDGGGATLLVTGSNMSGKSTLLRAMGCNVVLALAGAPVSARALTTSVFDVHTSMRVRDSLSEGVSHFLAELRRLKQVIDAAEQATKAKGNPVLFLLDEILHGTNSRERHLGARAIVTHLVSLRACGAVSTHDLALASLEAELPGRVTNVHFREQVGPGEDGKETMTFDYHLRKGVVTSSNALRLMRIVGIDIAIPPPLEGEGA